MKELIKRKKVWYGRNWVCWIYTCFLQETASVYIVQTWDDIFAVTSSSSQQLAVGQQCLVWQTKSWMVSLGPHGDGWHPRPQSKLWSRFSWLHTHLFAPFLFPERRWSSHQFRIVFLRATLKLIARPSQDLTQSDPIFLFVQRYLTQSDRIFLFVQRYRLSFFADFFTVPRHVRAACLFSTHTVQLFHFFVFRSTETVPFSSAVLAPCYINYSDVTN